MFINDKYFRNILGRSPSLYSISLFPLILWHCWLRRKKVGSAGAIYCLCHFLPTSWCLVTAVPLSRRKKNKLNRSEKELHRASKQSNEIYRETTGHYNTICVSYQIINPLNALLLSETEIVTHVLSCESQKHYWNL